MKKLNVIVAVLCMVISSSAFAKAGQGYVAPLAGLNMITSTVPTGGDSMFFTWGATVGYHLSDDWGIAAYFSTVSQTGGSTSTIMAELNWMSADMAGFYVGPRVGVGMASTDDIVVPVIGTIPGTSTTNFGAGVQVGYDFPVATSLTIGGQLNWNIFFSDPESSHALNVVVPVKWWF